MNQLNNIIPSGTARKVIYSVFSVLALGYSAYGVAIAAVHIVDPSWYVAAGAVLVFLGVPTGGLALSNTPSASSSTAAPAPAAIAGATVPAAPDLPTAQTADDSAAS